ncbi:hypothetical protein PIB30_022699 [Stylosanthes scabra]|uniref:Uncharacterized protein n=1 Tax=Stylosanthes scabra TaxID=79078 RepID=A0ABU6X8S2_9FABA|nr:hypothetical protein [Stylosanthes scabra]
MELKPTWPNMTLLFLEAKMKKMKERKVGCHLIRAQLTWIWILALTPVGPCTSSTHVYNAGVQELFVQSEGIVHNSNEQSSVPPRAEATQVVASEGDAIEAIKTKELCEIWEISFKSRDDDEYLITIAGGRVPKRPK